ncbi:MAG: quinone oxidoreductase family protein [Micromonosporaceae bacterium]
MRAIQVTSTGGPEVLQPVDREPGPLADGQVRVEVAAAGVNFIDIYERTGLYPRQLPYVPGSEGAGRVVEVAADVTGLRVGDRVAWQGVPGSYASEVVAPAWQLLLVPTEIKDQHAAALPLQGLTAHYLATSSYPIQPGDTVVVHAGAGGVGLLLTQIAKLRGARVITTVSTPEKAELSRAAGADLVVGYDELAEAIRRDTGGVGVAAAYDGVGQDTFDTSLQSLAPRGALVLYGQSSGKVGPLDLDKLRLGGSLSVSRPTLKDFVASRDELRRRAGELFDWVTTGRVAVRVGGVYPLADAGTAHADLAGRRTTGKLLLSP